VSKSGADDHAIKTITAWANRIQFAAKAILDALEGQSLAW
jgi:hypothetical protein